MTHILSALPTRLMLSLALVATLAACDSADDLTDLDATGSPADTFAPAGASLAQATCTGTLGAITVEDVIVPQGARCVLEGTRVQGNVQVLERARLVARSAIIGANVQASNARDVRLLKSTTVGGNVQLGQGISGVVRTTRVNGDIQIDQNRGAFVLDRNRVGGNLQVFGNTGGVSMTGNRVAENLQCGENQPPPTGSGNIAGSLEGQCSSLG